MHMSTKLTREPRQARSRETLSRIVEAALALIRESLDGDFTLREVAEVTGLGVTTVQTHMERGLRRLRMELGIDDV